MSDPLLDFHPRVVKALREGKPVVALESTLIAHGLPWPLNLETARAAEQVILEAGATPATIALWHGKPTIGLNDEQIEGLAKSGEVLKASRRDLGAAVAGQRTAATTVAGTMALAHRAGIRVFATGGIGGVHRDSETTGDISADLHELARTPVAVVCAGAKNILDLRRTLEMLETLGVPVIGYRTDDFPAFYLQGSGERVSSRVESPDEAAQVIAAHWSLGGAGCVIAQPAEASVALDPEEWETALVKAERQAALATVRGKEVTPFLLARLAEITKGKTLRANQSLIIANARLAARIASRVSALSRK